MHIKVFIKVWNIPYNIPYFMVFVKLWLQRKFNFQKCKIFQIRKLRFYLQYIMSVTNPRNSSLRSHLLWDESRVQCLILWPFLPYFMTFFLEEELGRDAVRDLEWRVLNHKHIQHCMQKSFYQTIKWAFFQYLGVPAPPIR